MAATAIAKSQGGIPVSSKGSENMQDKTAKKTDTTARQKICITVDRGTSDTGLYVYKKNEKGEVVILKNKVKIKRGSGDDWQTELSNIKAEIQKVDGYATAKIRILLSAWARDPNIKAKDKQLRIGIEGLCSVYKDCTVESLTTDREKELSGKSFAHCLEMRKKNNPRTVKISLENSAPLEGGGGSAQSFHVVFKDQAEEMCGRKAEELLRQGKTLRETCQWMEENAFAPMVKDSEKEALKRIEYLFLQGIFAIGTVFVVDVADPQTDPWTTGERPLKANFVMDVLQQKIGQCEALVKAAMDQAIGTSGIENILPQTEEKVEPDKKDEHTRLVLLNLILENKDTGYEGCKTYEDFKNKHLKEKTISSDLAIALAELIDALAMQANIMPAALALAMNNAIVKKRGDDKFYIVNMKEPMTTAGGGQIKLTGHHGAAMEALLVKDEVVDEKGERDGGGDTSSAFQASSDFKEDKQLKKSSAQERASASNTGDTQTSSFSFHFPDSSTINKFFQDLGDRLLDGR